MYKKYLTFVLNSFADKFDVYKAYMNWTTGVRTLAEAKDFSSSLCVQTSSEAYPASYPMGTMGSLLWVKHGSCGTLTTHPHLQLRSRAKRSYISSPCCLLQGIAGQLYLQGLHEKTAVNLYRTGIGYSNLCTVGLMVHYYSS
jgi:hypothetical protein